MLFLTSANDLSSPQIIKGLKEAIDLTIITELSPQNIKLIDFNRLRTIVLKSEITMKGCINHVEYEEIFYFLNYLFGKPSISIYGQNFVSQPSKPMVLETAKQIGLAVPDFIITNSKKVLIEFLAKKKRIVCKSLQSQRLFRFSDNPFERYNPFTCEIESSMLENIDEYFFPSFFQEYVSKDIELKLFYFNGVFFPAALIPNTNMVTDTDIKASPYRCVPYAIHDHLQQRLDQLMKHFNWRMGTIDLLVKDMKIFFLEVNPSGQFGNISYECGYDIETFLTKELIKEYKK